jgi:Ca2+-transporting ATPase
VFEAEREEPDIDTRPPRPPAAPLFSRGLILWSVAQGLAATALVGAAYAWGLSQSLPEGELRALTFFSLVAAIVALVFVNRTFATGPLSAFAQPSGTLLAVPVAVDSAASAVLFIPALSALFRFGPLHGHDAGIICGGAVVLLIVLQLLKRLAVPALRR